MKKKPTKTKRKNVQDLTLKNLHAMKKRIATLEKTILEILGHVGLVKIGNCLYKSTIISPKKGKK